METPWYEADALTQAQQQRNDALELMDEMEVEVHELTTQNEKLKKRLIYSEKRIEDQNKLIAKYKKTIQHLNEDLLNQKGRSRKKKHYHQKKNNSQHDKKRRNNRWFDRDLKNNLTRK